MSSRRWSLLMTVGLVLASRGFVNADGPQPIPQGQDRPDPTVRELRQLTGPEDQIRAVSFSPDGKYVAAGGAFNTIRVWGTATGKELQKLEGHTNWALWVAFAPDGKTLASAGFDGTVRLWDSLTGEPRRRLEGHTAPETTHVAFSADGKLLASASYDGTVRIWDATRGKQLHCCVGHDACTYVVAFAPDGKTLASGGHDHKVRFWDVATGKQLREGADHTDCITALAFTPEGNAVFSGSHDGTIRLWDVSTGKQLRSWSGQGGWARTLSLSADGKTLAVANENGTARLWEVATAQVRRTIAADDGYTWTVAFAPDGRTVATGGNNRTVRLWDITGREPRGNEKPRALTATELEAYWNDLAGKDAARAYSAVWALAAVPHQSVPFLSKHLRPEPARGVDEKRLTQLIRELESDSFQVRAKATEELERAGPAAEASLRKALKEGNPSVEQTRRIEKLLEKLEEAVPPPEELRVYRGIEVLEHMSRLHCQQSLEVLAKGPADALLTREARAALRRLEQRPRNDP